MKIPWTAKRVFGAGAVDAVRATIGDGDLTDLDDGALAVLDRARNRRVRGRVRGAGATDRGRAVCGARRATGNGMSTTVAGSVHRPRHRVAVVGDPDRRVALQLAGVVSTVGRVRATAGRGTGLAADVRDVGGDQHVGVLGRTRDAGLTFSFTNPHVRRGAVGGRRTDRDGGRRLNRRVTGRERQRRSVRPVRCGTRVERGHQRRPATGWRPSAAGDVALAIEATTIITSAAAAKPRAAPSSS